MKRLPITTGWLWLKQGFALFRLQPGFLTMILFCNFLFAIVLNAVPLLGGILSLVFIPSFTMAVMQTCRVIDDGAPIKPALLMTGFRPPAFQLLCRLGMVYFGLFVLLLLAVSPWIDVEAVRQISKMTDARAQSLLQGSTTIALLAYVFMMMVMLLLLAFAPALVYWKQMPTFKAIFYSVFAVLGSFRAILGLVLSWLAIYWAMGLLLTLILGRSQVVLVVLMWLNLVFFLILQCALYVAYKQLMGAPEAPPLKA